MSGLRSALAALGGAGDPPPVDADDARRTADEILRGSEYDEPSESLIERVLDWLFERLGDLMPSGPGGGPGNLIGWVVVAALVVAAAWFVYKAVVARPRKRRRSTEPAVRFGTESHRDAAVWLDEAGRLAAAGDHRGAIRCRHQAMVARLITDGVLDDVPGRTAGEYRDLVARAVPDEQDRLERLTRRFDDVWYGDVPAGATDHEAFVADCDAVERAVADARNRPPVPA